MRPSEPTPLEDCRTLLRRLTALADTGALDRKRFDQLVALLGANLTAIEGELVFAKSEAALDAAGFSPPGRNACRFVGPFAVFEGGKSTSPPFGKIKLI